MNEATGQPGQSVEDTTLSGQARDTTLRDSALPLKRSGLDA